MIEPIHPFECGELDSAGRSLLEDISMPRIPRDNGNWGSGSSGTENAVQPSCWSSSRSSLAHDDNCFTDDPALPQKEFT